MSQIKLPPYQRKKSVSSIQSQNLICSPNLPAGYIPLDNQVAGHTFKSGTNEIGILKDQGDGTIIYKSASKVLCGEREIAFYESIQDGQDPFMNMLKELTPQYRGTVKLSIGGKNLNFLKLCDLTHNMLDPCIMDIKIGKRTWDPLASPEKILAEESKYVDCKQKLGFCVPGFQVYNILTGKLKKLGKDYGKKLNEETLKDALRIFLNADSGLYRSLITQFLSGLWSIQKWARTQKSLRLYSSSILFVYDARKLRNLIQMANKSPNEAPATSVENKIENSTVSAAKTEPSKMYRKVSRSHSIQNNYDADLKAIRENYMLMLDDLTAIESNEWATVKMIDFAHVFESEEDALDENYLFGIENIVKMFEEFLKEAK